MSEIGTFKPEGSVKEFDNGVGGNEGRFGRAPNCPRLALEDVGVRPGTASKKSAFDGDGELYEGSNPRLAKCVWEIGNDGPGAVRLESGWLSGKVLARRGSVKSLSENCGRDPIDCGELSWRRFLDSWSSLPCLTASGSLSNMF